MSGRFTDQFKKAEFNGLFYRHFKPTEGSAKLPLFLFLHGVGECGTDNESQLWYPFFNDETSIFSQSSREKFPCHIIAPQAQDENRWVDMRDWGQSDLMLAKESTKSLNAVGELTRHFIENAEIDATRVYITGLSMGAFGVYELLIRNPDLFAAAVAICGGTDLKAVAAIRNVPLRVYHGNRDKVVPVDRSRSISDVLSPLNVDFEYVELDQVGHNAWEYAFRDETLLPWLFNQHRRISF
jgi:predicted peptidase